MNAERRGTAYLQVIWPCQSSSFHPFRPSSSLFPRRQTGPRTERPPREHLSSSSWGGVLTASDLAAAEMLASRVNGMSVRLTWGRSYRRPHSSPPMSCNSRIPVISCRLAIPSCSTLQRRVTRQRVGACNDSGGGPGATRVRRLAEGLGRERRGWEMMVKSKRDKRPGAAQTESVAKQTMASRGTSCLS